MAKPSDYYTADEIRQRLSISTLVFQGYRPFSEQALEQLAENNITRIEIVESPDQYDLGDIRSMRLVDATCRKSGIEVAAYHAYKTRFRTWRPNPNARIASTCVDVRSTRYSSSAAHSGVVMRWPRGLSKRATGNWRDTSRERRP